MVASGDHPGWVAADFWRSLRRRPYWVCGPDCAALLSSAPGARASPADSGFGALRGDFPGAGRYARSDGNRSLGTAGRDSYRLYRRSSLPLPAAPDQAGIRRMSRMLEFSSVTFSYNGATLFGGITLGVEEGARVALVGANGSGKTTLLKLAAGLLRPVEGSVSFQGRDLRSVPRRELARQMAYVPQQMVAPFDFTVRQIVEQGRTPHLKMMGSFRQRDREAVESAMEAAAVTSLANRVYNRLSGGEQQRVKIAVALAQEPKLLLLDEPTQHLDIGRQAEILELLADLNRRGVTMVAAIHDLYAVHWYFPSMILLHLDRKLVQGETEVILQQETIERAFGIHARVP